MNPVVLLLSTYPYVKPQHGGQIRLASIAKAYKNAGWQVENIALLTYDVYPKEDLGPNDFPLSNDPAWREFEGKKIPYIEDYLTGVYASSEAGGFPLILERLPQRIDAIHVEQPWLWPVAKRIKELIKYRNVLLIYGSQNIETSLKRLIFEGQNINDIKNILNEIDHLEKQAIQEADICFAVTREDLDILIKCGAKNAHLAANGIEPWTAKEEDLAKWKQKLPTTPWPLFVSSAHPPNYTGFTDVVGDSLGFIPPNSKFVVAGGVSEYIYQAVIKSPWHEINTARLQLLFVLPDADLAAVKSLAHIFLLPIHVGGGSNIKTAEAIYSGAYVIGTKSAFRGYEHLMHLPEIITADTPSEFQTAVRETLKYPVPHSKEIKNIERKSLIWEKILAIIPKTIEDMRRKNYE